MPTTLRLHALVVSCLLSGLGISCGTAGTNSSAENETTPAWRQSPPQESRAEKNLRKRAAHDLKCAEDQLTLNDLGSGSRGVDGCGHRATYVLVRSPNGFRTWVMNSVEQEITVKAPVSEAESSGNFKTTKGSDGNTNPVLELPRSSPDLGLRLLSRPAVYADRVLLRFERHSTKKTLESCSPRMVVDGNLVATPSSKYSHEKMFESVSIELPVRELEVMGQAQRAVADLCGSRIELTERELALVREYLVRFREEQAFAGTAPAQPAGAAAPSAEGMGKL